MGSRLFIRGSRMGGRVKRWKGEEGRGGEVWDWRFLGGGY